LSGYDGLSLFRLRVFVAVVDEGGYAAAARVLDVAQPTVAFHVQALERLYATRLLQFHDRRVVLTPAGEAVLRGARVMLQDAHNLERLVREVRDGAVGHLTLGASMALELPSFFTCILAPFRAAWPRVGLSIHFGHSIGLAERVADRTLDLAYVLSWHFPSGVHHEPLHEAEFVYMVAAHHPLARAERVTPRQIAEAGIIAAPIDSLEWANYDRLLRASGVSDPRIAAEIEGFQPRVLAAQAGWGVLGMFVPPFAGQPLAPPLGLKQLHLDGPPARAEFSLVSADERLWTPVVASFADWLRQATARPAG
jgi:DNA-binding transcriptional LysR family regulator